MSTMERDLIGNPTIKFFKAPQVSQESKMDFNSFAYYKQTNLRTERLTREQFWDLVLLPKAKFVPGTSFRMMPVNGDGPLVPAHIPNLAYYYPLDHTFHYLFRWHLSNDLPLTMNTLIPPYLMHLLDPKPVLDLEQAPYNITTYTETLRVAMASFTDALQVVKLPTFHNVLHVKVFRQLTGDVPDHHTIVSDPFTTKYIPQISHLSPVPPGAILVCWNVRDVARPSFIQNFTAMFEVYKPSIMVLLETRNTVWNLYETVAKIPGNITFYYLIMDSHSGGVALLWRWQELYCTTRFKGPGHLGVLDVMVKAYPGAREEGTWIFSH